MANRIKLKWSAKQVYGKTRKAPTYGDMNKYLRPVLMATRGRAHKHYRDIMKKWSVKNRAKLRRVTGRKVLNGTMTMYSSVGTDLPSPLVWLGEGTDVRRRGMTRDWVSKTWPRMGIGAQHKGRGYAADSWGLLSRNRAQALPRGNHRGHRERFL